MIEVQIVILTRDRPNFVLEAAQSFLGDLPDYVELVVSDNSVENETEYALKALNNLRYVRRWPPMASANHFKLVLEECTAPFLIMFHDDDIVTPDYLQVMLAAIKSSPKIVAVGCNAYIMKKGQVTSRKMMGFFSSPKFISRSDQLLQPYYGFGENEPPPFSSYIYRTDIIKKAGLSVECGKHSDVTTLNELLKFGDILWLPDCLMYYRYHSTNDGKEFSVGDKLKLIRYAISRKIYSKHSDPISDLRVRIHLYSILSLIKKQKVRLFRWRLKVLSKYVLLTIFFLLFSRRFWLRILSRCAW